MSNETEYRYHLIKSKVIAGKPQAAIVLGIHAMPRSRFDGETLHEAEKLAKDWLDEEISKTAAKRRAVNVATAEEYRSFFTLFFSSGLSSSKQTLVSMLSLNARKGATSVFELAEEAGYSTFSPVNSAYGNLGLAIAKRLELEPVPVTEEVERWTSVLAEGRQDEDGNGFRWTLHPEVVDGLTRAGIVK